jgi:ketosteroid isomerase-like protein
VYRGRVRRGGVANGDGVRSDSVVIATLTLLLCSGCARPPSSDVANERHHLQRREAEFLSALGARDLEQTTAHFAEDAVLHVADMPPVYGRDAIAKFYQNLFRFLSSSSGTPELMRTSSSGDLAYSTGTVENVFGAEPQATHYSGKYLLVWEKRAGEWAIVLYGVSNNRSATSRQP